MRRPTRSSTSPGPTCPQSWDWTSKRRVNVRLGRLGTPLFGAPIALEGHALRACLAALGIQDEVTWPGADVDRRDGIALRLRVGLNSGQVIAGDIGSRRLGYTAVGAQVGMAQRMESVAPSSGVMLSEST